MATTAQIAINRELSAAGVKASGNFNDVRFGPFVFSPLMTDNATTASNLRTAAVIQDAQLDALGATANNPPIYLIVNGYRLRFPSEADSADLNRQIKASPYLYHEPTKGPQRSIQLAPGIGTIASGSGATLLVCSDAPVVRIKNPMLIAMRRETFELRFNTAVNMAGNLTGILELYGFAVPDDVALTPVSIDCVSEADAVNIGRQGIKGRNLL